MVSRGHQGLVTYVQTELGSSRPCQTPEGTSCGTEKKVGVGKERREAWAGAGRGVRKAQESGAFFRSITVLPWPSFGSRTVHARRNCPRHSRPLCAAEEAAPTRVRDPGGRVASASGSEPLAGP
ncbi:hypothetical protein CapIbe_017877 [Capra ibex]